MGRRVLKFDGPSGRGLWIALRAMLIKSALRDWLSMSYSMLSILRIGSLRSPPKGETAEWYMKYMTRCFSPQIPRFPLRGNASKRQKGVQGRAPIGCFIAILTANRRPVSFLLLTLVHPFDTSWPSSPKGDARTLRDWLSVSYVTQYPVPPIFSFPLEVARELDS